MRRAAWLWAVIAVACTDRDVIIAPTNGAKAMIVVSAANGSPIEAHALEVGATTSFYSLPVPDQDVDLFLFGYACSLEDLAISPGKLSIVGEGRKLGQTKAVLRSEVRGGAATDWSRTETDLLDKIKIDTRPWARCATFNFTRHELTQDPFAPAYAVAIGDDEALVADSNGSIFRVGKTMFRLLPPNPDLGAAAAFAGPDRGSVWTIGADERVTLGDATLENIQPFGRLQSGSISSFAWMTGSPEPELFVLTDQQHVAYKFGVPGEWQTITASTSTTIRAGSIAQIAPGEALVLREPDRGDLIELVKPPDVVIPMRVPIDLQSDGLTEVAFIPGIGPVAGTRRGLFFRFDGVAWVQMPLVNAGRIRTIAPIHDGFLTAGDAGAIAQFDPTLGDFCEPVRIGTQEIGILLPVGDDFVAVTGNDLGQDGIEAYYMTSSPRPPACALP